MPFSSCCFGTLVLRALRLRLLLLFSTAFVGRWVGVWVCMLLPGVQTRGIPAKKQAPRPKTLKVPSQQRAPDCRVRWNESLAQLTFSYQALNASRATWGFVSNARVIYEWFRIHATSVQFVLESRESGACRG